MVDNNNSIAGISIKKHSYNITQFADDTTIFLHGSWDSLIATLNTLEIVGSLSGLKVNTDKTKIIWLGKNILRICMKPHRSLTGVQLNLTCWGLQFSVDLNKIPAMNYSLIIKLPEAQVLIELTYVRILH